MSLATVVDWAALGDVVLASFLAVIGVTITFSLSIFGAARYGEVRRQERAASAVPYAVLAVAGLAVTAGAVVLGLVVMVSK